MTEAVLAYSWDGIERDTLCRVKGRGIASAFRFLYARTTHTETALTLYGPVKIDPATGEGLPHLGVQGYISVKPELVTPWPVRTRAARRGKASAKKQGKGKGRGRGRADAKGRSRVGTA